MKLPNFERDYDPVAEYFTQDAGNALDFLGELTDESCLAHHNYSKRRKKVQGCSTGPELAKELATASNEGAYLGIYNWEDIDDLSTPGRNELYLAISDEIGEKVPEEVSGDQLLVVEGYDENMTTHELCRLADEFFNGSEP